MKYFLYPTKTYKKQLKKYGRSGKFNLEELEGVISLLADGKKLPQKYKDHGLSGNLSDFRECHVEPDLLLVYKIEESKLTLVLVNLGSHSELFE